MSMQDDKKLSLKDWFELNLGSNNVQRTVLLIALAVIFLTIGALGFFVLYCISLFVSAFVGFVSSYILGDSFADTVGSVCMVAFLILGTLAGVFYLLEEFLSISRLNFKKK